MFTLLHDTGIILHYACLAVCKVPFRVRQRLHRFFGSLFRMTLKAPRKLFDNFYPAIAQISFPIPVMRMNRKKLLILRRSPREGVELQFFISLLMTPWRRFHLRYDHSGAAVPVFADDSNGFGDGISRPFETKTYRLFYLPRPPCG